MKRDYVVLGCVFIVVTFLVGSFAQRVAAVKLGSHSTLSESADPSVTAKPFSGIEVQSYIRDYNVTQQEAIRRLELQSSIAEMKHKLITEEGTVFGGLWVEHVPEFKIHINVTKDGRQALEERLQSSSLWELIQINEVPFSLAALEMTAERVVREIARNEIRFDYDINIPENRVEIYVMDSVLQSKNAQLAESVSDFSSVVKLVGVKGLSRQTIGIQGGRRLTLLTGENRCTTGFAVIHTASNRKGVITAGHCANSLKYDGKRTLIFQAEEWQNSASYPYDVQWHTSSSSVDTFRPYISTGNGSMVIYGKLPRAYHYVGQYVCKYGITTKNGCGTIVGVNFNGTYIRVHSDTEDLSEPRDSGGPWYTDYTAMGIMTGDIEPGNDAYYMAIDYISSLGLEVLIYTN